jgi:hypothetical protein
LSLSITLFLTFTLSSLSRRCSLSSRRLEALLYLASFRLALNIVYSLRDLSKTVAGSDQKVKGFKGIKA